VLRIGIDLGTTFSCVAWVDDDGRPSIIPNAEGELITPSVLCFDGRQAWVGRKAVLRKDSHPFDIVELVKRDMGKPDVPGPQTGRATGEPKYVKDGFYWGPAGMSALILRKLKRDAIRFFRGQGQLDSAADDLSTEIEAVITVPAYFGSVERDHTALAAYAAGLRVTGIINEPTAAALAYGLAGESSGRILVFDLGGGTFDVTILQMEGQAAHVLTSQGDNKLGGKDWDALIERHLYEEFQRANGRDVDDQRGFEIQALALEAKLELSALPSTRVKASFDEGDLDVELFRDAPDPSGFECDLSGGMAFYFDLRASGLLRRLEVLCASALVRAQVAGSSGRDRSLTWDDIDEVIMTGGACRMPMIGGLLERLAGRRVRRLASGVELDTSVATGAALYSRRRALVMDVLSKTIGVLVVRAGELVIEPMLRKDAALPTQAERRFPAAERAFIEVYELDHDESVRPDENRARGRVELDNAGAQAEVVVRFSADDSGVVKVSARYPPDFEREFELNFGGACSAAEADRLRDRVRQVRMQG